MSAEQGGTTGPEKPTGLALVDAGKSADGIDEAFRRSMASLSRQLAAVRSAESAAQIGAGAKHLQADFALEGPVSRRPLFKLVLAFALGVAAATLGTYAFQAVSRPAPTPAPPPPDTAEMTAAPASAPSALPAVSSPSPAIDPAAAVQPSPEVAAPAVPAVPEAPDMPVPPIQTPDQAELSAAEVLELQTRLESLGMSPGFLDGIPGPRTAAAVRRYEEARGQPSTGTLDRELLKRLRQEPN